MALSPSLTPKPIQYSTSSGCPPSHGQRITYDSPLSFAAKRAYSTSQRISLQTLQDRARMCSKDQSMERSLSSASRASFGAMKRSVPGMKSLLPLKLLSPTLPEFDSWPLHEPAKRSTFGTRLPSDDFEVSSEIGDRARDSLISKKRSQQYRDTPIYNEPGSPVPSRAYFSEDDVCFNYSQPGSICNADEIVQDFVSLKDCHMEDDDDQEGNATQTPETIKNVSRRSTTTPTSRWSELSFQCSGEALYENESVWLRSPMKIPAGHRRNQRFNERVVESWLSDTSSSFEHEEVLACATALSPSKAHVIDLKANPSHPSDLSVRIPARSSSLMGTSVPGNSFWETCGTPPITPSMPWDHDPDMPTSARELSKDTIMLPKRRLDLNIPSPPLSPHRPPATLSIATESPMKCMPMRLSSNDIDYQWPLPSSNISPPSLTDIIGSLEASISSFPSSIVLSDSPCISAIRSRITHHAPPSTEVRTSPTLLKPPFGQEFPQPPSYQPTGAPRAPKLLSERGKSSNASSPPHHRSLHTARASSLPIPSQPSCLYPPDLTPFQRIFPKTSDFMRSALYAHVVAHIFITSLPPAISKLEKPQLKRFSGRRRDTPYWTSSPLSSKAANFLGIEFQDDSTSDSAEKQLQLKIRIESLQQSLRNCIYCLTSVMDSNIGIEDIPEMDDNGLGCVNGELFIRTLEEVVLSCESKSMV